VILLDTHMWVWLNDGDSRLPRVVVDRLVSEGGSLSAVSIWEFAMLLEKGRLVSDLPAELKVRDMLNRYPLSVVPVDLDIALMTRSLPFEHDDPADRFIAATAHRHSIPLATCDQRLTALPWLQTIS